MAKWFYILDGQSSGPIETPVLKQLATTGRLKPTDKIRREDMAQWTEAKQVKGLFASAEPTAASTVVTANKCRETTSTSVSDAPAHQRSSVSQPASGSDADPEPASIAPATKITLAICGTIFLPILGFFVWFVAIRDSWEATHSDAVTAQLDKADHIQQLDPDAAYKIYNDALNEAKRHKLKNEEFVTRLAHAEKSRRAAEVERKRQADEQAQREGVEKERLAQKKRSKHTAEVKSRLSGWWRSSWKEDDYTLIYEFRDDGLVAICYDDGFVLSGLGAIYRVEYEIGDSETPLTVVFKISERESRQSDSLRASIEFPTNKSIKFKYLDDAPKIALIAMPREEELVRYDATEKGDAISAISWADIDSIYNLKSTHTSLQKKLEWSRFEGKRVDWTGKVSYVSDGIAGLTLQVKMNRDTLTSDLLIELKSHEKFKAARLHEGDEVRFTGTLEDWGSILPITLTGGRIVSW